jgi:hypothetical protein
MIKPRSKEGDLFSKNIEILDGLQMLLTALGLCTDDLVDLLVSLAVDPSPRDFPHCRELSDSVKVIQLPDKRKSARGRLHLAEHDDGQAACRLRPGPVHRMPRIWSSESIDLLLHRKRGDSRRASARPRHNYRGDGFDCQGTEFEI